MFERLKKFIADRLGMAKQAKQDTPKEKDKPRRSLPIPKFKGRIRLPKFGGRKRRPPEPRVEPTHYPTSRSHPREV